MTREIERMDERMYLDEANGNGLDEDVEIVSGDVPPLHARELYAQYDAKRAEFVAPDTCHKLHAQIAELEREVDDANKWAKQYHDDWVAMRDERDAARAREKDYFVELSHLQDAITRVMAFNVGESPVDVVIRYGVEYPKLISQLNAANKRAKEYVDVFKRVNAAKRVWRKRAEQAEAKLVEAQSRLIAGAVYEKLDSINYWKTRAEQAEAEARALAEYASISAIVADVEYGSKKMERVMALIAKYLESEK